jgi:hypothetical protein
MCFKISVRKSWILILAVSVVLLPAAARANFIEVAQLPEQRGPRDAQNVLSGIPEYFWWYGCSPTSGGMLVAFWDAKPGFENLVDGDVSWWSETEPYNTVAQDMIASQEHIDDYWDWHGQQPTPHQEHPDNCIADFMGTIDGGTYDADIPIGLEDFTEWDNPNTSVNESYPCDSSLDWVPIEGGTFTYDAFKAEIDAGRPMMLGEMEYHGAEGWYGHSVVAYGYQDDMFDIQVYTDTGYQNITVGGFAIWDTWGTDSSQSSWRAWDGAGTVTSYLDGEGREWWPFVTFDDTDGYSYDGGYWDWTIDSGVYYQPHSGPEPGALALLGSGGVLILFGHRWRRKKRGQQQQTKSVP